MHCLLRFTAYSHKKSKQTFYCFHCFSKRQHNTVSRHCWLIRQLHSPKKQPPLALPAKYTFPVPKKRQLIWFHNCLTGNLPIRVHLDGFEPSHPCTLAIELQIFIWPDSNRQPQVYTIQINLLNLWRKNCTIYQ